MNTPSSSEMNTVDIIIDGKQHRVTLSQADLQELVAGESLLIIAYNVLLCFSRWAPSEGYCLLYLFLGGVESVSFITLYFRLSNRSVKVASICVVNRWRRRAFIKHQRRGASVTLGAFVSHRRRRAFVDRR